MRFFGPERASWILEVFTLPATVHQVGQSFEVFLSIEACQNHQLFRLGFVEEATDLKVGGVEAVEAESAGVLLFQRVSQKAGDGHVCVALPDQILSFDHPEIIAAYERAKAVGNYESVLAHTGKKVKHYGLTDHKEYFAEGTEAFFYRNDLYPFVRAELRARFEAVVSPNLHSTKAAHNKFAPLLL